MSTKPFIPAHSHSHSTVMRLQMIRTMALPTAIVTGASAGKTKVGGKTIITALAIDIFLKLCLSQHMPGCGRGLSELICFRCLAMAVIGV